MFLKFLRLEIKSFLRSPQLAAGIAMKIGMFFMLFYMALIFLGGAFGLYFFAKKEQLNPIILLSQFFLFYWIADLLLKYFMQQLPANNIKPFLTQNVTKSTLANYTLAKIMVSFFSWVFLLFMVPFSILLLTDDYSKLSVLGFVLALSSCIVCNSFINIIINKNNTLLYLVFGIIGAVGLLYYFRLIDVLAISQRIFYPFYAHSWLAILSVMVTGVLGYFTFRFIKNTLFLDKGLELKKAAGKTENIAFLNKYGATGTFLNNDIRMIKRSKAAKSALIGGFLFLFYGLLAFSSSAYQTSFMQVFMGIFVTGGFNFMFGQRVPAWDSSYYPLMMTQNVPYKKYLQAKWALFVIATIISTVLAIGYAFISWEYYFTIFAAGLYNLGVNSYLTLFAGAFNKKPIDLNSSSKGFTAGQNNFNIKIFLMMIPQMLLPMTVFALVKYFFGMTPAVVSLGLLGLTGFLLRDKIFDLIVKQYKIEKYSTLSAFKKID